MQTNVLPDETPDELKNRLQNTADKIEETSYYKDLTEEDILLRREVVTNNTIEFIRLGHELKRVAAEYKLKMQPLQDIIKKYCGEISSGQEYVEGIVYHFYDFESTPAMVTAVNDLGEIITSRRMTPEEKVKNKQLTIAK